MASSAKSSPVKMRENKTERAASLERPVKPEEETVVETHELAMILRVKRQGGWGLEGIPLEAFNQQTVKWKVQQVTGIEPIRAEIVTT